jgi:hypothetical protein
VRILVLIPIASLSVILSSVGGMNLYLNQVAKTEGVSTEVRERMSGLALNCGLYGALGSAVAILCFGLADRKQLTQKQELEAVRRYANRQLAAGKSFVTWTEILGEVMSHE